MINLKKGQYSPSLSEKFRKEFNNSSDQTLSFIDATLRAVLLDKLAFLRRQRDDILVPFVKMSIPEDILAAMSLYPKYFKSTRAIEITNETRSRITFVSSLFPTEEDAIKLFVPAFIFDEVVSIDNCIEDVLKNISELK